MSSLGLPLSHGVRAERRPEPRESLAWLRRRARRLEARLQRKPLSRHQAFANEVQAFAAALERASPAVFDAILAQTRRELRQRGLAHAASIRAVALVSHAIFRQTGLRAYDTQIIAARIMLDEGLAEMQTGEGKSLAIQLAACAAALAGIPVHVLTANDYLAQRDADAARPIAARLGLRVGVIATAMDNAERRENYLADLTFSTAREVVFDYLRDATRAQRHPEPLRQLADAMTQTGIAELPVLRGLHFALIDEADSILLDEALTPFILSRQGKPLLETAHLALALEIARQLIPGEDFELWPAQRRVELTDAGQARVEDASREHSGLWRVERFRNHLIEQALAALRLFERDRDYLVKSGEIHIIDAVTGRLAEGRKWSQGIHQLLELKESLTPSEELEQLARISYQQFFPRYLRLAGTSATLHEDRRELLDAYRLPTSRVPLRLPCQRRDLGRRLFPDREQKWTAALDRAREMRDKGRSVLIAVESVAESRQLSLRFTAAEIPHVVLNARQDAEEAAIIARAGEPGAVTIATNMAGRGTDIKLAPETRRAGGLHVTLTHLNNSARIDRQARGRCARNGQPGSVESIHSLQDRLIQAYTPDWIAALLRRHGKKQPLPGWLATLILAFPQRLEQWRARRMRQHMKRHEETLRDLMAIGGNKSLQV